MIGYVDGDPQDWDHTRGAARVVGVNLTSAVVDGWLSRTELGDLVHTCHCCSASAPCTDFLARTSAAESLPAYCPNKSAIESLRP